MLNENQTKRLHELLVQEKLERVAPKLEAFRDHYMIKGARGGRGAGAKSWSMTSLIVQEANYTFQRVLCLREIQEALEESVYELIQKTVDRLRYPRWHFTNKYIMSPTGTKFGFKGLKDLRASRNIKGLEGYTRFFIEEAAPITDESWDMVLPTLFRTSKAELWFCYNPETETDPVTRKIWLPYSKSKRAKLIDLRPENQDNPWFNEDMMELSRRMREEDPDLWEHIYGGKPLKQGERAVISRAHIRAAMDRNIEDPKGEIQIGVDVARFGDDKTTMYKRHGMKVIDQKVFKGQDTQFTARAAWDFADRNSRVKIKVDDSGVGGGVTDKLRDVGANVMPINFGAKPRDQDRFTSVADEMWFTFPVEDADIPDDPELMEELSSRLYKYTRTEQRQIESKDDMKKRIGRSPDKADGLLLCYYDPAPGAFAGVIF